MNHGVIHYFHHRKNNGEESKSDLVANECYVVLLAESAILQLYTKRAVGGNGHRKVKTLVVVVRKVSSEHI